MAYPLTIAPFWKSSGEILGASAPVQAQYQQGAANGGQPSLVNVLQVDSTQKFRLGSITRFTDETYGEIEAIYLKGVANTAQYDAVVYDPNLATTTRTVAASRGPLAVALSNPGAGQFGWYAISGQVPVSTAAAGTGAARAGLSVTATAGQLTVGAGAGAAADVDNAICKSAQDTPAVGFTNVQLARPSIQY